MSRLFVYFFLKPVDLILVKVMKPSQLLFRRMLKLHILLLDLVHPHHHFFKRVKIALIFFDQVIVFDCDIFKVVEFQLELCELVFLLFDQELLNLQNSVFFGELAFI